MKSLQELVRQYEDILDTEKSKSIFSRTIDKAASFVFSEEKIVLNNLDKSRVQELVLKHQLPSSSNVLMYIDINRSGEINDSSVLITEQEHSVFHGFKKTATGFRLRWEDITAIESGEINWLFVCGLGAFETRVVAPKSYFIGENEETRKKEPELLNFLREACANAPHPFAPFYEEAEQLAGQKQPEKLEKLYARLNFDPALYFEPMYFAVAARAGNQDVGGFIRTARSAMEERFVGIYSPEARQEQDFLRKIESAIHEYKLEEAVALCEKYVEEFAEESSDLVFGFALGALDTQLSALNDAKIHNPVKRDQLYFKIDKFKSARKKAAKKREQVESDMKQLHPLKLLWFKFETMLALIETSSQQSNRALYEDLIRLGSLENECADLSGSQLYDKDARWVKAQLERLKAGKQPIVAAFKASFPELPVEERRFVMIQDQLPLKAPAAGFALTQDMLPEGMTFGLEGRKKGETLIAHPVEKHKYFTQEELSLYDLCEKAAELNMIVSALGAEDASVDIETVIDEHTETAMNDELKAYMDGETVKQLSKGWASVTKLIEAAGNALGSKSNETSSQQQATLTNPTTKTDSAKPAGSSKSEGITPAGEIDLAMLEKEMSAANNYVKSKVNMTTKGQANSRPHLPDESKLNYYHKEKEWQLFAEGRLSGKNDETEKTIVIESDKSKDYSSSEYNKANACLRLSAVTAGTGIGRQKETSEDKKIKANFKLRLNVKAKFASLFEPQITVKIIGADGRPYANSKVLVQREREEEFPEVTNENGALILYNATRDSIIRFRTPDKNERTAEEVKIRFNQTEYTVQL